MRGMLHEDVIRKAASNLSEPIDSDAKATTADQVYELLRSLVVTGALPPGTPLDQHRLAALLMISRTPLRHALSRLSQDGLVETKARSVARVASLSRAEAKELYALRAAIEPLAAKTACLGAKPDDISKLRSLNKEMSMAIHQRRYDDFVVHDREFHRRLYAPSTFLRTKDYIERLRDASDRYVRAYILHSADSVTSVEEHEAILQAYDDRDVEEVGQLIAAHVERGAKTLLDLID